MVTIKENKKYLVFLFLLFPFFSFPLFGTELDVKEMVYEHLEDSYEWHLFKYGEEDIAIPLPVILFSHQCGWQVFSSAYVADGQTYKGFCLATEGENKGKIVELVSGGQEVRPRLDLSLTKNAIGLIINCSILLLLILPLANRYKKDSFIPPKGISGIVEVILVNIQDTVIKPCVGEDYKRFSPYLLTVFFFILVNNLMGLVPFFPGGANLTGNIAVTMVLAITTFLVVNINGSKEYWKEIFWPDVPVWLKIPVPLMPLIELFGILTKPFALMIRLFANIMAGHAVILGLVSLIFITATMGAAINTGMTSVSVIFTLFMNCVEILVAFIQAYVFTLLSAVFIGSARVKHE